ncbi:unnamed protein product, partial [marine sediment metagenome]
VLNVLPESVHISSGEVQIMGYDYLSGEYRLVAVNESGQIEIKATVADIVTARVSGIVAVVSGEVHVMSGQVDVFMMSGEAVAKISGQTVALQSGTGPILTKVSGETVELQSGTGPILAKISGETLIAKVSGETITAKVSGETVSIETPTMVKTGPVRTLSDASGGVVLHSGEVKAAMVKALTDNSGVVLVGGSGDRPWYEAAGSAQGMVLAAGEAQSKDISDFDQVYVVAQISGDRVAFDGVY